MAKDNGAFRQADRATHEQNPSVSALRVGIANARPANPEMVEGYIDGGDLDNPEPSDNRSHSYRHGFANGRADRIGKPAFPSADVARTLAEIAMEKDETAYSADPTGDLPKHPIPTIERTDNGE